MARCFCGFTTPHEPRFLAHLAWADKLPTKAARMRHHTMEAPGPANAGQARLDA